MSFSVSFSHDVEFQKLLSRDENVDIATLGLEIARDAYPKLDFAPTLAWIDDRARDIAPHVARAGNDAGVLHAVVDCLGGTYALHGDEECYAMPEASYLNRIVETGRGIPIGLSVVYLAIAERLGIALDGVCAPMHFLMRYESVEGPLFLDAFSGGRIRDLDECAEWIAGISGWSADDVEGTLHAAGLREIVIRILNNLKSLYAQSDDWQANWNVQQRLSALEPASYEQRRDLAVIAVRSQRAGIAVDLLQSCLRNGPADDREMLNNELKLARTHLSQWN